MTDEKAAVEDGYDEEGNYIGQRTCGVCGRDLTASYPEGSGPYSDDSNALSYSIGVDQDNANVCEECAKKYPGPIDDLLVFVLQKRIEEKKNH